MSGRTRTYSPESEVHYTTTYATDTFFLLLPPRSSSPFPSPGCLCSLPFLLLPPFLLRKCCPGVFMFLARGVYVSCPGCLCSLPGVFMFLALGVYVPCPPHGVHGCLWLFIAVPACLWCLFWCLWLARRCLCSLPAGVYCLLFIAYFRFLVGTHFPNFPQGVYGCPPGVLPPFGWSTAFIAAPLTVGRIPLLLFPPAFPSFSFSLPHTTPS
jgi:hypothetical protein